MAGMRKISKYMISPVYSNASALSRICGAGEVEGAYRTSSPIRETPFRRRLKGAVERFLAQAIL